MIVETDKALTALALGDDKSDETERKLKAIESLVRAYTNNNFQLKAARFWGAAVDGKIRGGSPYIDIGDTVEIGQSDINAGLYTVVAITATETELDRPLFDSDNVMVTKIVYPEAVQETAIQMLSWDLKQRQKLGVASESLSRHSISYADQNANQVSGYPASIMSTLAPWVKMRR